MSNFKVHNAKGSSRPKGLKADQIVHARGGNQELIARADRIDWRNVSSWRESIDPITQIVDYSLCDGCCD
jgi:hypothetical protein